MGNSNFKNEGIEIDMQNKKNDDKNNNFFNQNPLVTFAIFSVVIILLFKVVVGEGNGLDTTSGQGSNKRAKQVSYSGI